MNHARRKRTGSLAQVLSAWGATLASDPISTLVLERSPYVARHEQVSPSTAIVGG